MERKAIVYFNNTKCGVLLQNDDGYEFTYDFIYLTDPKSRSISLRLPLSEETYYSNILFPFFDGLIPEGWLLDIYANKYNLKTTDRFSLLLQLTEDPIGAVSVKEVL